MRWCRLSYLIGFMLMSNWIYSQQNTYFVSHPVWKIRMDNAHAYPCMRYGTNNVFFGAAISVDTIQVYPVYERQTAYYDWQSPLPPYSECEGSIIYDSVFKGYVHSIGKQVYYRGSLSDSDQLLYDFDLEIGDSIYNLPLLDFDTLVVIQIDSIPVGVNTYWKRFEVQGSDYVNFILEGIGSSAGFLESMQKPYNISTELLCYSLSGEKFFPEEEVSDCIFFLGLETPDPEIHIYPNPFSDVIHLQGNSGFVDCDYRLIAMSGEILCAGTVREQLTDIETLAFQNGMYLLEIRQQENVIFRQKFVKQ